MPGDKRSGPPATKRPPLVPPGTEAMVSHRLDARRRVEAVERHRRICRAADRLMPLSVYYQTWGWPEGRYCELVEGQAMPA